MKRILSLLFAVMAIAMSDIVCADNQPLAFPGADGYAKHITGGRGGKVYYVTSLQDCSDDNLVPGTLRWALRTGDDTPRTILFAVNGTIYLESKLKTNHANVSILGQSAPGGGICITGYPVVVNNRNYIIRYIRFRAGDIPAIEAGGNESFSGLDIENATQVILDHCSVTWSMEECLTMFDNDTTNVQYCIIGEGLYHSYNVKTTGDDSGRAFAMQWGGDHSNMHHTLITNCNGRAPRFNGVREANAWQSGSNGKQYAHDCHIDGDFANNVLYNWGGGHLSYYGGEFYADYFKNAPEGLNAYNRIWMRNNYFRPGPSTQKNGSSYRHFFHPSGDNLNQVGEWYLSGNKFELSSYYAPTGSNWTDASLKNVNNDNLAGFGTSTSALDLSSSYKSKIMTDIPYELSGYEPVSADQAYQEVTHATRGAGANLPRYDEEDQRLIDEAAGRRDGKTPFQGSRATKAANRPGIIDTPSDVKFTGGNDSFTTAAGNTYSYYPSLAMKSGERYAIDSDGDGMPDAYEVAKGLDKSNPADGNALLANGYTQLEAYLNGLADGSLQNSDYQTSATYVEPGLETRPEKVTITFVNKNPEIIGTAPEPMTIAYGESVTFMPSYTFYQEGYTMTGWTDGNMTYAFKKPYANFTADVTLQPSMSKNRLNLKDRSDDLTISWDFVSPRAPKLSAGNSGIYVTPVAIENDTIDAMLRYEGLTLIFDACPKAVCTINYIDGKQQTATTDNNQLKITATSADISELTLLLPYYFDPTGIEFHAPQVGHCTFDSRAPHNPGNAAGFKAEEAEHYELIYCDTLTIDALSWMTTIGQHRNAYRNSIDPIKDDGTFSAESASMAALDGFVVGSSFSSTYRMVAYVKDCGRVRTFASGSNSNGDRVTLTAIASDNSGRLSASNLHLLDKSSVLAESFDLELDPEKSYMLVWTSLRGYDMMISAIKLFDATAASPSNGDVTAIWQWQNDLDETAIVTPATVFQETGIKFGADIKHYEPYPAASMIGFQPTSRTGGEETYIAIQANTASNMMFQPTKLSFNVLDDYGEGYMRVTYLLGDGTETEIIKEFSVDEIESSTGYHEVEIKDIPLSRNPVMVKFYFRNIGKNDLIYLSNVTLSGKYEKHAVAYSLTLACNPVGAGQFSILPKQESYQPGESVSITATSNAGYVFDCWTSADGKVISYTPSITYEMQSDVTLIANFIDLAKSPIFTAGHGLFNAIVSNARELQLALAAASQSTAERYRIFLRKGEYDFGTTAMTAVPQNTSLIGESQEDVLLFNNPGTVTDYQNQTPVLFIDQNQNNVYMQDLTIRQARDWADKTSRGQALALRQRGKQAIYKQVTMQGVQDTYYLNKADGTAYFEDCTVAGEVDFIYGDGTMFFEHCTLNPVSSAAYITAPNTQPGYKGIVFNDCHIARPADAKDAVTGYKLGRPWGDSPAATFINTTMEVLPSDAGWGSMSTGLVLRFHEYGSKDANGNLLDLSKRSIAGCSAASGSDSPVLTEAQAADYTLDKVFPEWTPATQTVQLVAPTPQKDNDGNLSWTAVDGALCYAIVCDGSVIDFTTDTHYATPSTGTYTLRVANAMGGLGLASTSVEVTYTGIESLSTLNCQLSTPFDLMGRQVTAPRNGQILLRNGKVMILK